MNKKSARYIELDFLRGYAIVAMFIFHFLVLLNLSGATSFNLWSGAFNIFGNSIRYTFLGLVGVSLAISSKTYSQQLKRALIIALCALTVTIFSYLIIPDFYIRFGVLHFIAVSIILLAPLKKSPKTAIAIAFIALFLSKLLVYLPTKNLFLQILGFFPVGYSTLDHFPIIPWIAAPAFGIAIGNYLYAKKHSLFPKSASKNTAVKSLAFLGRHSLLIYMTHIPIILLILFSLGIIQIT